MKKHLSLIARSCIALSMGAGVCAAPAAASNDPYSDVCRLLSTTSIERAQGGSFASSKPTLHDDGNLTTAQCFYELKPSSRSVSLQLIARRAKDGLDPAQLWNNKFHGKKSGSDGDEQDVEEGKSKERRKPPERLEGIGDEAFWVDTGRDSALYVLFDSKLLRLSLGGDAKQADKRKNAISLAQEVIKNSKKQ